MAGEHDAAGPDDDGRHSGDPDSGLNADFSLRDIIWVLLRLETRARPPIVDSSLILIGGQALNYWCDRYRAGHPDLNQHGPFASKDIDFQASRALIPWCSEQVGGEYTLAVSGDKSSLMNGVVNIRVAGGKKLRLDFMQCAYGLSAEEVEKASAPVVLHSEGISFGIRVMHPLHCMKSRVKNVMGLPDQYANAHGLSQLRASILCLRLFIEEGGAQDERFGTALNEKVFKFALHDLEANKLLQVHGIDVFEAASKADCFSEKYRTIRYPQMVAELAKKRSFASR